ncbi:hypothetical protein O3P69_004670 [Scylla paramamosain]|uniref:Uncharacterized protein n=1 Tax=Scylla paramamosain TaxID=85552 RepID=A0AAW0UAR6_SCYPA
MVNHLFITFLVRSTENLLLISWAMDSHKSCLARFHRVHYLSQSLLLTVHYRCFSNAVKLPDCRHREVFLQLERADLARIVVLDVAGAASVARDVVGSEITAWVPALSIGSRIPTLPVSGPGGEISSFQGSRIPSLPIGRPGSLFDPFGPARCWGRCMGLDALGRCRPQPLCFITFK